MVDSLTQEKNELKLHYTRKKKKKKDSKNLPIYLKKKLTKIFVKNKYWGPTSQEWFENNNNNNNNIIIITTLTCSDEKSQFAHTFDLNLIYSPRN